MNILLIIATLVVCGVVIWFKPGQAPGALAVCAATSLPTLFILARSGNEKKFLMRLFILGVLARIIVATIIFVGGMEEFFGGDANTYHLFGQSLARSWHGDAYHATVYAGFIKSGASAWGMVYVVAVVYELIGANVFAIQLLNASVGSATAVVVYYTAQTLFNNTRVSRVAAVLVAFFPSLILWSAQALKDGLIILA